MNLKLIVFNFILIAIMIIPLHGFQMNEMENYPLGVQVGDTIDLYLQEYVNINFSLLPHERWDELEVGELIMQYEILNITDQIIMYGYRVSMGQAIDPSTNYTTYAITTIRNSNIGNVVVHLNFTKLKDQFNVDLEAYERDQEKWNVKISYLLFDMQNEIGTTLKIDKPIDQNDNTSNKELHMEMIYVNDKRSGKLIYQYEYTEYVYKNGTKQYWSFTLAAQGYVFELNSDSGSTSIRSLFNLFDLLLVYFLLLVVIIKKPIKIIDL